MKQAASHRLRQAIRQVQRERNPKRRRYDQKLRRRVVDHVLAERSRGRSVRSIAAWLGLPYKTLHIWMRSRPVGFRVVAAKPSDPADPRPEFRLVLAQGHRVEGLSREDLVAVLRALS